MLPKPRRCVRSSAKSKSNRGVPTPPSASTKCVARTMSGVLSRTLMTWAATIRSPPELVSSLRRLTLSTIVTFEVASRIGTRTLSGEYRAPVGQKMHRRQVVQAERFRYSMELTAWGTRARGCLDASAQARRSPDLNRKTDDPASGTDQNGVKRRGCRRCRPRRDLAPHAAARARVRHKR